MVPIALKSLRDVRLVRWLAPLWASLLLLWSVQAFFFGDYDNGAREVGHDPLPFAGLVLLMVLHIGTYVLGPIWQPERWRHLAYSGLQTGIVCAIMLDRRSVLLAVALILPLIAEAIGALRSARLLIAVVAEYLFAGCIVLLLAGDWHLVRGILVIVMPLTGFFTLVVVLVLRQLRTRERPPAYVQELEAAHRELAASLARVEELLASTPRPFAHGPKRRPKEQLDLTEREREVLGQVARGARNKEIAFSLRVSESTVKAHLVSIYAKLGVDARASAVAIALERHLLSQSSRES